MRAIALLCMLHAGFGQSQFIWGSATNTNVHLKDPASCGCCLMERQMQRMEEFFNEYHEELNEVLTISKTALNQMEATRSAFSVALNNDAGFNCFGPFNVSTLVVYKHIFLNLGDAYNTGIFTAPRSGVYSLALTVYSNITSRPNSSCTVMQVNGQPVAELPRQKGKDLEDSATVVVTVELKAGDKVGVNLPPGCFICDNNSHFNTFTGFLLYPSD
ncbi:complement C1q-like protein 4 [Cottoperca gobio]|uniref:Complement C1q-like protein 4 n=1 Tax=Cottoperca gobio TaxID=56716 RepID=A0A6J2QX24_COTGO|nr:complement C1q-like protein 4 [Cottoperca gobio]